MLKTDAYLWMHIAQLCLINLDEYKTIYKETYC